MTDKEKVIILLACPDSNQTKGLVDCVWSKPYITCMECPMKPCRGHLRRKTLIEYLIKDWKPQ